MTEFIDENLGAVMNIMADGRERTLNDIRNSIPGFPKKNTMLKRLVKRGYLASVRTHSTIIYRAVGVPK